jgi:putative transposase
MNRKENERPEGPTSGATMPQSLSKIAVHSVFSTKHRAAIIAEPLWDELHTYTGGVLREHGCSPIRVGGVADHVHILFELSRTMTIAKIMETVKTATSKWLKSKSPLLVNFHWQNGYGAFSVSEAEVEAVTAYIANQKDHHKRKTFQEEFQGLLHSCKVDYDERYVWD